MTLSDAQSNYSEREIRDLTYWTTVYAYGEWVPTARSPERIIGPLLEELPLRDWCLIMWPEMERGFTESGEE